MELSRRACVVVVCAAAAATLRLGAQAPAPDAGARGAGPATGASPAAGARAAQLPAPSQASITRAAAILADSQKAMGGDKLAAVKTIVVTGRARRVRGNNLVPIEFEISMELPDKYLRRDESPAEESAPATSGFNGDDLIQVPPPPMPGPPPAGRPGGPPPPTPEQLAEQRQTRMTASVAAVKQDFARLALGLFASTFNYPMTFSFAAEAEAPQGRASVLDGHGPGGFALRLFIDETTHLPIMVSWQAPPTSVIILAPGQPQPEIVAAGAVVVTGPATPAAGASQAEKDQYTKDVAALRAKTMAPFVKNRLYFADSRQADGIQFPYRLRRAIGADTTEETIVDRFKLNASIDPKKFQAAK